MTGLKADERRLALLDRLADHVLAQGLSASSLRPLAKAAGTSDRMLLYYFKDKQEVVAATLEHIAGRLTGVLGARTAAAPRPLAELVPALAEILMADELWPYMRLWLEIASLAGSGDAFYRQVGEAIGRGFLDWGGAQLASATPAEHAVEAAQLLVRIEGMVLLKSIGMADVGLRSLG